MGLFDFLGGGQASGAGQGFGIGQGRGMLGQMYPDMDPGARQAAALVGIGDLLRGGSGATGINLATMMNQGRLADEDRKRKEAERQASVDLMTGIFKGQTAPQQRTPVAPLDPNTPQGIASDAMKAIGQGDRDILAKTIMAEAGNQGIEGMLAAGAVMDNRLRSGRYGDTMRDVIMAPGQFSAWNSVTGYAGGQGGLDMANMQPSQDAYRVADAILGGQYTDPTGGATHYYNPSVADPAWGQRAGGDWQRIGDHVFGFADGRPRSTQQAQPAMDPQRASAILMDPHIPDIVKQRVLGMVMPQQGAGFRQVTGEQARQLGLDPNKAYNVGPDGKITQIGGAGTSVTVQTGDPSLGKLSTDYTYLRDASGEIVRDAQGAPVAVPVPGSPAARDIAAAEEKAGLAQEATEVSGDVVTEDISRALDLVENAPAWTTGLGSVFKDVPGTQAKTLSGLIDTIKANVGFDKLQSMRDASPTGGALGQVSEIELRLLNSALGSLEQSLNAETLAFNLNRINDIYMDIVHGKGNRPVEGASPTASAPLSDNDLLKMYGGQ